MDNFSVENVETWMNSNRMKIFFNVSRPGFLTRALIDKDNSIIYFSGHNVMPLFMQEMNAVLMPFLYSFFVNNVDEQNI